MSAPALDPVTDPVPQHQPVMLAEVLAALSPLSGQLLLDGTIGHGGHAAAWLEATAPEGRVIGLDRDADALVVAAERLASNIGRVTLLHGDYRQATELLGSARPDAVVLDLGLGSHQLGDPARGFAFRLDGPLDMRFDRSGPGATAADLIARLPEPELVRVLAEYGEERHAKKIARAIVDERRRAPIRTTGELADLVRRANPPSRHDRIDPATRTFQALRIAVNAELEGLAAALQALVGLLPRGGRIAVIAFQSLEDRIVKTTFRQLAEPGWHPRGQAAPPVGEALLDMPVRRAIQPTDAEISQNPRARSARLRWGIRR